MTRLALAIALLAPAAALADQIFLAPGTPGRTTCGLAGTAWQTPAFDERTWLAASSAQVQLPAVDAAPPVCTGTLYARWHFAVSRPEQLASLAMRLRYQHGFAAYLNGVEIARRRLDPQATSQTLASESHGLLPETITLPVTSGLLRDGDNLLAIEVHPNKSGQPPVLDVELVGRAGARILRGPYLQNVSSTSVDVLLDTDLPTTATLQLVADGAVARELQSSRGKRHLFHLDQLKAATRYAYQVTFTDERGQPTEVTRTPFHTPPSAGKPLRFVVYGDVRSGHDMHAALNRAILDEDPDFVVMTGDLVAAGSDDGDWERYFAVAQTLIGSVAVYPAPGNHEYYRMNRGRPKFLDYFRVSPNPSATPTGWASFEQGGVRFLALDSNEYRTAAHLDWLKGELEKAKARRQPVFVYSHEGPYATGLHGDNGFAIANYVPLYEKYGVAMIMYGHDHHYERGRVGKTNYLLSGGGGAELRVPHCSPTRKCNARVLAYANEHHYVLIEIIGRTFRVCPMRADGTAIEACVSYPLPVVR